MDTDMWEPYAEYIFRKTYLDHMERLLLKYGPGSPIPTWETEKVEQELKKLSDENSK